MKPTVHLHPNEIADMYALKTFYDYVRDKIPGLNFEFYTELDIPKYDEFLSGAEHRVYRPGQLVDVQNLVQTYSDVGGRINANKTLTIDISILKNAVNPLTDNDKQALRSRYGVPSDKPLCVIGYSRNGLFETEIAAKMDGLANMIFVGITDPLKFSEIWRVHWELQGLKFRAPSSSHLFINEKGLLRDYYAMSDITFNAAEIGCPERVLHNFVEATEGGPYFSTETIKSDQFGYRQLVQAGAIRAFKSPEEAMAAAVHYVKNFNGKHEHTQKRAKHLAGAREKYLPVLERFARRIFLGGPAPKTDLYADEMPSSKKVHIRLTHPETDWERTFTW